jgi:hypothetical protein
MTRKVKLSTYQKPFGVWVTDPGGMICKVAECQALRDSFPTMCGGMYLREEAALQGELLDTPTREAKRPDFGKGMAPVEIGGTVVSRVPKPAPEPSKAAEGPKTAPEASKPLPEATSDSQSALGTAETGPTDAAGESDDKELSAMGLAPAETPEATVVGDPTPAPEPEAQLDPKLNAKTGDSDAISSIKLLAQKSGCSHDMIMKWAVVSRIAKPGQSLSDLSESKLIQMGSKWSLILPKIKEQKP